MTTANLFLSIAAFPNKDNREHDLLAHVPALLAHASSLQAGLDWVQHYIENGDVVVSLGAGNVNWIVYSLRDWILADELDVSQQHDIKDEMA